MVKAVGGLLTQWEGGSLGLDGGEGLREGSVSTVIGDIIGVRKEALDVKERREQDQALYMISFDRDIDC